jgi:hypothetical protein
MATAKIGIINYQDNTSSRVVYVEPWADDYTLLPGEELVIFADSDAEEHPWFNVVESTNATQVYCEATSGFSVWQNGRELACGHNRGR